MDLPTLTVIATKTFSARINLDNGVISVPQGYRDFSMELTNSREDVYNIEWDIPSLGYIIEIGIWTKGMKVLEYDGVFELPSQAIELLEENGFDCSQVKD
jgi:hypothetical protein